jgi:hypothetical protein
VQAPFSNIRTGKELEGRTVATLEEGDLAASPRPLNGCAGTTAGKGRRGVLRIALIESRSSERNE